MWSGIVREIMSVATYLITPHMRLRHKHVQRLEIIVHTMLNEALNKDNTPIKEIELFFPQI